MRRTIEVQAYREGRWWVFEVPELGEPSSVSGAMMMPVGQARSASKVAAEARALVALWLNVAETEVEVAVRFVLPESVTEAQQRARDLEAKGRAELDEAARLRRESVRALLDEDVSQTDAAAILGMSRQRVQQLA